MLTVGDTKTGRNGSLAIHSNAKWKTARMMFESEKATRQLGGLFFKGE